MASKPSTPARSKTSPRVPAAKRPTAEAAAETAAEAPPKGGVALKIKPLVDRVAETSGVAKKDTRAVVEALLAEMGAALARGEGMSLPGLGHLRVVKRAPEGGPMTLKLRQGAAPGAGKGKAKGAEASQDALAEPGEDS